MARQTWIQNAFNSGELSPYIAGRTDITRYGAGAQIIENFWIRPTGGVTRRSGSRFVLECDDSAKKSRLVPFIFSSTQAYILEFGNNVIRVFKNEAPVLAATHSFATTDVDAGTERVTISGGHFYIASQGPFRLTTTGTLPAGWSLATDYYIRYVSATVFELSLTAGGAAVAITDVGAGTHTITPQSTTYFELTTTYTEAQLYDLGFAQSNDTLYIVHSAHAPAKLTRTGHTTWTLTDIVFKDGPWMAQNTGTITVDPGANSGATTLTASSALFASDGSDVGRMFRVQSGGAADSLKDRPWAWGRIVAPYVSTTVANWTIDSTSPDLSDNTATVRWRFGAFGTSSTTGYPSVVTFQEQRLFFAANPGGPQTVYASKTANFENFAITTDYGTPTSGRAVIADDNGFTYTIASNQVNVIRWMNPIRALVIGTNNGVWTMQASTPQEAVTPTNVQIRRSTVTGCGAIESVNVDDEVVFISDSYSRVLIVGYQFDKDSYKPLDATLYSEHIGAGGFDDIAYAHEPLRTIYFVRSDGVLCGLTYMQDQSVIGFSRHILGGSFGSGDAVVESVAVIPAPNEDHDQVWVTVKRTINGAMKRYVEFFEQEFASTDVLADAYFVDCGLSYSGSAATIITGLDHLYGETVQILADGGVVPDAVVGAVTGGVGFVLTTAASKVHAGLAYASNVSPFPPDTADREGTAQGKAGRAVETKIRFYRTAEGKIGQSASTLSEMDFRSTTDLMNQPTPLFTDDYNVVIDSEFDLGRELYVRQDLPLPMTILALLQSVWTGDR